MSTNAPDSAGASTNIQDGVEAVVGEPEAVEPPSRGGARALNLLSERSLRIEILLFVCIIEGALIVKLRRDGRRTMLADASVLEFAVKKKPEDDGDESSNTANGKVGGEADAQLSGSIAQFPINQVIQLLSSSGETGVLWVTPGDGGRMHKLLFLNGGLIDAETGARRGMDVLVAILKSETGSFSFRRDDTSVHEHRFEQDTMSLLLKAMRMIDEK